MHYKSSSSNCEFPCNPGPGISKMNSELKPWLALGFPLAILLAYTAFCGISRPATYRLETPMYAAQAVGQDCANLSMILPAFTITLILSWRGSLRALLVHAGILAYLVYSYSMYAITIHFNSMFLSYTACFGLSLYSVVGILTNIDSEVLRTAITQSSSHKRFRIGLASLFIIEAALFYKMWLSEIIPHLQAGTIPKSIAETGLPSNMVHVIDLGLVLPLVLLTSMWLLSSSRLGYLFAPTLLNFSVCMMAALASMIFVMYFKGQTKTLKPMILFVLLFVVNLALSAVYLKSLIGKEQQKSSRKRS